MEELETKVARKSIQKRTPKRGTEGITPHAFSTSKFRHLSSFIINGARVEATYSFGAGYIDFYLVKTNASGEIQWHQTYGGPNAEIAYSVVQTFGGGYAICGLTNSFGDGGDDFWLVKVNSDGSMLWNKTYGGTRDDWARSMVQTSDGGYVLAGVTYSTGTGDADFWLVGLNFNPAHTRNFFAQGAGIRIFL